MRKKREKCWRRLMALLAAVCMLNAMPYTSLTVSASENSSLEAEDKEILEQEENADTEQTDTEETEDAAADAGQTEDTEELDADDSGQTKEPGVSENDDSEQDGGQETEDTEDSENPEDSDKKEDLENGEAEVEEENPEESIMLFAEETEDNGEDTVTDGTYTDENGIVYHYYAYEDGTANIYALEPYRGNSVNIPEDIDGYTVTQLTFKMWGTVSSVTIPETVTYIGAAAFASMDIGTLYYNAVAEVQVEQMPNAPFRHTKIGTLVTGENVHIIPAYIFSFTEFQEDITITAEAIGEEAFAFAAFPSVTLTKQIKEIQGRAFVGADMQTLYYDTEAEHIRESSTDGMFRGASIQELVIDESITKLPDYVFSYADFCFREYTVNVEWIGAHAFDRAWGSADKCCERLTLSDRVNYIGADAFANDHITMLNLQANAESGASGEYDGSFYCSYITELSISEDVMVIPDYMFSNAHVAVDELVLNVESIGKYAFHSSTIHIGNLTIGEAVSHIGDWAFGNSTCDKAVIYAVESDSEVRSDIADHLPVCKEVEIHGNSPYYEYFTRRSEKENIELLCVDFETTYGEEYYDEEKGSFVTPITDSCVVCGYEKTSEEDKEACTVIFKDHDGRELSRQYVIVGKDADAPEVPERTGYEFTGWDKSFTNVTSDITITAQYEIKSFYVSFKDNETIISKQKIEYGSDAKLPENPTRPEEEWGTWKFTGWNGNYRNVIQDEIIQAQFEKVINKYEVIFYDAERNILSKQTVTHGEDAEIPNAPEKQATAQYHYTFTGWNGDTENITENTSFYPVYDAQERSYTVTFMNGDTVLDTQTVTYGKAAIAPENPERAEEVWGTWKFAGWIGDYTNITRDRMIRAQFEKIFNEYEVLFYDEDGNVLSRQTVAYGQSAKAPEVPEKEPTEQYCYPFTGWNGDIANITADAAFYPIYGMEIRTYTVTFMNDAVVFAKQEVEYGASAKTPDEPKKETDAKYSYHFTGWDGDYSAITGDMVIHALYEQKEIPPKKEPEKEDDTGKKNEESGGSESGSNGGKPAPDAGGENTNPVTEDNSGENTNPVTEDNGGENPAPETEDGNTENPNIVPSILTEEQSYGAALSEEMMPGELQSDMDPEIDTYIEMPVKELLSEDMDGVEISQKEVMEDMAEDDSGMSVFGWFILLIGIMLFVFLFIRLLFLYFTRRKVCGTILDKVGSVPCGIQISLSGKEIRETELDEDGSFRFDGLKKGDYRMNVYDKDSNKIFSADIRMDNGNGKVVFLILESDCHKIETNKKRGKYEVNLIV